MMLETMKELLSERDCTIILKALITSPSTPRDLSRMYGIPIAKCYSLLSRLERMDMVKKDTVGANVSVYSLSQRQVSVEVMGTNARIRLESLLDLAEAVEKRVRMG
ncbi:MAG: hypothetical protein KAT70_02875 [Thermoplasmata archaeon]|nr:hypothetical protein [Thermoplasmata archaeon]